MNNETFLEAAALYDPGKQLLSYANEGHVTHDLVTLYFYVDIIRPKDVAHLGQLMSGRNTLGEHVRRMNLLDGYATLNGLPALQHRQGRHVGHGRRRAGVRGGSSAPAYRILLGSGLSSGGSAAQ